MENIYGNIRLTIGMIVKNEEKVLERCLKSLLPLIKSVKSELIIADTGSTDSTFKVAKKYTDNVFHFKWNDDFSDARNSTLKKASGVWYMYLDADEYLDCDISDLIYFIKSENMYANYDYADLLFKNYNGKSNLDYAVARLPRIVKIKDDTLFSGIIHETIKVCGPIYHINTVIHHTGYKFQSIDEYNSKMERNAKLLDIELGKSPNDLRLLSFMIKSCKNKPEKQEIYLNKALSIAKNNLQNEYTNSVFQTAIIFFIEHKEYQIALNVCNEYSVMINNSSNRIFIMGIYFLKALIFTELMQYSKAIEEYIRYFDFYQKYESSKTDNDDLRFMVVAGISKKEFHQAMCTYIFCLCKKNEYDTVNKILESNDIINHDCEIFQMYIECLMDIECSEKKCFFLLKVYNNLSFHVTNVENKKYISLTLCNLYVDHHYRKCIEQCVEKNLFSGPFIDIIKLSSNSNVIKSKIEHMLNNTDCYKYCMTLIVYFALKYCVDLTNYIDREMSSVLTMQFEYLSLFDEEISKIIYNYGCDEIFFVSIKRLFWLSSIYEIAITKCTNLDDSIKDLIYLRYITLMRNYIENIYNPDLLNDDDISVLPSNHQFIYNINIAERYLNSEDKISYIKRLKTALKVWEPASDIVNYLLKQFKNRLNNCE